MSVAVSEIREGVAGRVEGARMGLPPSDRPYGRSLRCGEKIGVFCDHQKPICMAEHQHEQMQLMLTFDAAAGELTWRTKAGRLTTEAVGPHQYSFVPPFVRHSFRWKAEADLVVLYLSERLLREHEIMPPKTVILGDFRSLARLDHDLWSLGAMVWRLCREPVEPPGSYLEGLGTALASRLLGRHFGPEVAPPATHPLFSQDVLKRVVTYIEAHLGGPIGIEDLARQAGLGISRFARIFKNTTGTPPLQFVLRYRVERALELLRTGQLRIAEAAYQVGFYDQSHLDRHCRKFFGHSPKAMLKVGAAAGSCREKPESSKISAA